MNEFSVGQWVVIKDHTFEGSLGFITNIDNIREQTWVRIIKNGKGRLITVKASYFFKPTEMIPAELESMDECLYNLIDLALSTRDKNWFTQLKQLEEK